MKNTDWYEKALNTAETRCRRCRTFLNPVEVLLSGESRLCLYCTKENHKKVMGKK